MAEKKKDQAKDGGVSRDDLNNLNAPEQVEVNEVEGGKDSLTSGCTYLCSGGCSG